MEEEIIQKCFLPVVRQMYIQESLQRYNYIPEVSCPIIFLSSSKVICSTSLIHLNKLSSLYKSWKSSLLFNRNRLSVVENKPSCFLRGLWNLSLKIALVLCSQIWEGQTPTLTLCCICFPTLWC